MKTDTEDRQWVLLEETYPHTLLLTKDEAEAQRQKMMMKFPHLSYTLFYDAYYQYVEYYSAEEKEQINRLIP